MPSPVVFACNRVSAYIKSIKRTQKMSFIDDFICNMHVMHCSGSENNSNRIVHINYIIITGFKNSGLLYRTSISFLFLRFFVLHLFLSLCPSRSHSPVCFIYRPVMNIKWSFFYMQCSNAGTSVEQIDINSDACVHRMHLAKLGRFETRYQIVISNSMSAHAQYEHWTSFKLFVYCLVVWLEITIWTKTGCVD